MAQNGNNVKWIVTTILSLGLAIAGWIFGGVSAKSAADHRLLYAQDEVLYKRAEETNRMIQLHEARIIQLERQMEIFSVKLDQILEILRRKP